MEVSVLILTHNREEKLKNLLVALSNQTYKQFDVTILVNACTDGTVEFLRKCIDDYSFSINPIFSKVNLGRAGGRNKLAASAKGSLLVFFDDDLRPLTNCISIHREHHAIFSNSILVGATPEDPALVTSDMHHYKAYLSAKWEKGLLKKQSCTTGDTLFLSAANMSIPASTFRELKGFNESLSDAEDLELGHRARQSGVRISYNSNAIAWHDDLITGRLYVLRQRQYQEAQEIIMALQDRQSPTWNRLSIAKRMMYNLFSRKLFVKMIDHSSLFLLIPRNLRYKMYSLIIWGLATTYRHREV